MAIRINPSTGTNSIQYQTPTLPTVQDPGVASGNGQSHEKSKGKKTPAVDLFNTSSYETRNSNVTLDDGTVLQVPTLSDEDAENLKALFGNVPEDQRANINQAGAQLAQALLQQGAPAATSASAGVNKVAAVSNSKRSLASTTSDGNGIADSGAVANTNGATYTLSQSSPALSAAIQNAASTYGSATGNSNYDTTVQAVAYMGVTSLQQSMSDYSTTLQNTIGQQSTIRTDRNELTDAVANWPAGTDTQTFTFHDVDANGNLQTYTQNLTQEQAKAKGDSLSNTLSTLSDSSQQQQLMLQNMMQNYQQGVTTISNIMRTQYDMIKNTLQNIHY